MTKLKFLFLLATALACSALLSSSYFIVDARASDDIPDLVGTWSGKNNTVSEKKGYRTWDKTVQITEQKGRRFKGQFTYSEGTKKFFGVIYPDNKSFTWVAPDSRGFNQGRILDNNRISACYVESGIEATAGCAELTRAK